MPSKSAEAKILPRRFDLIKKMYLSDKVIAVNKKDLILNWFFDNFGKYQKSSYTYEMLWQTFNEVLQIEKSQNSGHRILIKSSGLIDLLTAVENYPFSNSWSSTILSSITTFLQTPTVNSTLIADIDKLFLLLFASLKIICKICECNYNDEPSLREAKKLANIILDILENLPAANEEEKVLLLSDSLKDLAIFMYVAEADEELKHLSEKLVKRIVSIVFNFKNNKFATLLTPLDSNIVERPNQHILKFFRSLQSLLMSEDLAFQSISKSTTAGILMKKLVATFLIQNKFSLNYLKVVSLFFAVAGLDIPILITTDSCCNSLFKDRTPNSDVSISALSHLLEACSAVPQYFTSMGVSEGYLKPSAWLKGVSAALLDIKISRNKASWLKCFCSLLTISPSIIESDILLLIKVALLNVSVHSRESKKQYCELFSIILQTHSKLHQVPKFFVKLLLALTECIKENLGGNLLVNGQILPPVQESIARCIQELPYGQMIELWKIFIETFSTLENMSQAFMVSKGFIFFVAQLFSTFLLHAQLFQANIPSNINSQFNTLIEKTCDEIKKNISSLKETDSKIAPLQSSVLLLCYAIGEVKLLYDANHEKLPCKSELPMSDNNAFEFSILLEFLNEEYSTTLESYLNCDNKLLSVLVFQLILQRIRVLDYCSKFSQFSESLGKDTKFHIHLQKSISVILKCLQESCSATESWDMDMCTIDAKNYGTAYWTTFLKITPLVMNHLSSSDVYEFCCSLQNVILQEDGFETGAKSFILSSLKNGVFEDFKNFQTAFVSAIWRRENLFSKKRSHDDKEDCDSLIDKIFTGLTIYKSKSLKYAQRTPKSNKNLGSMWAEIEEITHDLNDVLKSDALPTNKLKIKKTRDIIKLFSCLPLKYLLPGNQMKCVVGLSVIFFLVPQNCKSNNDAVSLLKEISHILQTIFEGARSIWLFDFVHSGSYLKFVVMALESVISTECDDNYDWAIQLLEGLISLIVRNVQSLNNVEDCISELTSKNKCSRSTLITLYALLKKFTQVLAHPHKQENYKETLVRISSLTVQGFIRQMKINFKEDIDNFEHCYFVKCYTQVIEIVHGCPEVEHICKDCFELLPVVLENDVNIMKSSCVDSLRYVYLLFISKICNYTSKLTAFLPEDFVSVSWKILLSHFEEKRKKKMQIYKMNESLKITCVEPSNVSECSSCALCLIYLDGESVEEKSKNIGHTRCSDETILSPLSLNEFEEESLKELSVITSPEILSEVFHKLLEEMDCFGSAEKDIFSLQTSILVFQCIIDANNDKCVQPLLNQLIQQCLSQLHSIANQTCRSVVCQTMVIVPVLDFISFIVKGNKGLPKQVLLQILHCVIPVPLEVCNDNYELFIKLFDCAWKVVYDLYMHHTSLILASPAPFLNFVGNLLRSIVRAGAAVPISRCDANLSQQVLLCAQNMNRLLTVISRNKNEFSKLVPYLVADYVDTVQHITLDVNMKEAILSGIYRLLDICSEQSIKMLAVNINYVCREIYSNLVKNYRQNKHMASA